MSARRARGKIGSQIRGRKFTFLENGTELGGPGTSQPPKCVFNLAFNPSVVRCGVVWCDVVGYGVLHRGKNKRPLEEKKDRPEGKKRERIIHHTPWEGPVQLTTSKRRGDQAFFMEDMGNPSD